MQQKTKRRVFRNVFRNLLLAGKGRFRAGYGIKEGKVMLRAGYGSKDFQFKKNI